MHNIAYCYLQESHAFSVRQIQLAKHTPTQVIQLAYLCALLEQRDKPSDSKRFEALGHFLEEVVKVVPLESVLNAIAYERHDIALECAKALRERNPNLQPSQQMIVAAGTAAARASSGYNGAAINEFLLPLFLFSQNMLFQFFQSQQVQDDLPEPECQQSVKRRRQSSGREKHQSASLTHPSSQPSKKKGKKPSYSAVASGKSSESDGEPHTQAEKMMQPSQFIPVPLPIPVFLDQLPPPQPFPSYMVEYLNGCYRDLLCQLQKQGAIKSVVGTTSINEVYSVTTRRRSYFKSPLQVLRDAMSEIAAYTDETQRITSPRTETHNRQMLKLIGNIYKHDVAVCAALLGAFMEQQIRIPLLNSPKDTAEALSSKAAPVAVGVWALFSQNLSSLQQMLSSSNHSALIVEIKEYIEGIRQQLPENEAKMYAGKLQFLLQGIKGTVTASSQYISYSLEHQLCSNLKFKKSITLKQLIHHWDEIFENDALSLIVESHRPLVARWLKWTILVHDLRETLAKYTCIGVTGLVNSGKSLLVKDLFKIQVIGVSITVCVYRYAC